MQSCPPPLWLSYPILQRAATGPENGPPYCPACRGPDNAAVARQFHKSEKTVANRFTSIYDKLHECRGFREDIPVSRAVLVAQFAVYFVLEMRERKCI